MSFLEKSIKAAILKIASQNGSPRTQIMKELNTLYQVEGKRLPSEDVVKRCLINAVSKGVLIKSGPYRFKIKPKAVRRRVKKNTNVIEEYSDEQLEFNTETTVSTAKQGSQQEVVVETAESTSHSRKKKQSNASTNNSRETKQQPKKKKEEPNAQKKKKEEPNAQKKKKKEPNAQKKKKKEPTQRWVSNF